ncbi:MAG: lipoyl(octanoyl) transferase LipB [Candidatus Omnitrophica bacterium]|nr:lipoyl(octanoyl) transferase LipB [Candidatus Omnitrophota bacterium]
MKFLDLGTIGYAAALARQQELVGEVYAGAEDSLIFCEHPKTITLGRKFREANLLASADELSRQGFVVARADRGGDVTLHAPGQLIFYPIINLKRYSLGLKDYLHKLEQSAVDLLNDFGIVASGNEAQRGVWVAGRKVASIGIGVSRWVTYHGMGLNVSTDLALFNTMRPCGLNVRMTSLAWELKRAVDMPDIKLRAAQHFKRIFGCL